MDYLAKAIRKLRPNAEFSFIEEDYSTIEWFVLDGVAPSQAEIDAAIKSIKADELKQEAERQAKKAELLAKLGITEDEARLLLS